MPFTRILRSPLLHFLALGALLVAARAWLAGAGPSAADPRDRSGWLAQGDGPEAQAGLRSSRVELDAERVAELVDGFERRNGRPPTRQELEPLARAELDDELLYREALTRGLAANDPAIEARLVEKMLFLDDEADAADAPALLERARALGLEREDFVVRRLLVDKLVRLATELPPGEVPDEPALERAYHERSERLRSPAQISLIHVFLSRDRRGTRTAQDARAVLRRLERGGLGDDEAVRLGDSFPFGHVLARIDAGELDRIFGEGFGRRVDAHAHDGWSEPIASAYGLHLVRVDAREPGALAPFETVRERLRLELEAERRTARREALLATLRTRYELAVAWPEEESR